MMPRKAAAAGRPRSLARVLKDLGMPVPARIDALGFQALAASLRAGHGHELLLDGDPFRNDEVEPRIVRVRVRRLDPLALTPTPSDGVGEPPVEVVRTQSAAEPTPVKMRAFDLALGRFEMLTAVADIDRSKRPSWPRAFIDRAVGSLSLEDDELRLLGRVAIAFSVGAHGARNVIARLAGVLSPTEWSELLAAVIALNRDVAADTERVLATARALLGGPIVEQARLNAEREPESDFTEDQANDPNVETGEVRSLGALDSLFEKEKSS